MKVIAAAFLATATASTLSVTFQDCGDASTHATVTDVSPKTITSGQTNTVSGTGDLDEAVTGASFDATIKASGVTVATCNGPADTAVVCKLPLGAGSITLKPLTFPLAAGSVTLDTEVQLSSLIPASLAKTNVHIEGKGDNGDALVCLDIQTEKASLAARATASTLSVTFEDCGDASTHAKVTDVSPKTITSGQTNTVSGTGDLDEAVTGASFDATIKASGVTVATCNGPADTAVVCKLPLGAGSITLKPLTFPLAAGSVTLDTEVQLSSLIPASLAKTNVHIEGKGDNGDALVCLDIQTEKASLAARDLDCSAATCPKACTCSKDKCADQLSACLADSTCASSQDCAFKCSCGDTACLLKCAASSPSLKALPLATCVNSNCNEGLAARDLDCSAATCPKACTCSKDKCADQLSACLADATCASSQSCAFACSCGDTACMLACAAKSPSAKALPIATCVNSNCNEGLAARDLDCSAATCPKACTCSKDKCADQLSACLADATCASSQSCAFACSCGDTACMLACAAKSPSAKALPIATCVNSNCNEGETIV